MTPRSRRAWRTRGVALLTGFLALTLTACEGPDPSAGPGSRAPDGRSTLTLYKSSVHPRDVTPWGNDYDAHLLFLPLFERDAEGLRGVLVREYQTVDDTVWIYHLRSGIRWHDGVPVTAHDVVFTIDLWDRPAVLPFAPWGGIGNRKAEAIDDTTLVITYRSEGNYGRPPLDTYKTYLPHHLLAELDPEEFDRWDFWSHPVGNGPYRFARHVPQTMVELEANPDYFRGRPAIDRVILRSGGLPVVELEAGTVDVVEWAPIEVTTRLASDPRFDFYARETPFFEPLVFNLRHPILGDRRVRRALAHAIDRRELANVAGFPGDARLYDVPLTESQQHREEPLPPLLEHDPSESARLLEEAGWRDRDGDGVRERDGVPLEFTLLAGGPVLPVMLQEQFRRVGALVHIQALDFDLARERAEEGRFDAAIAGYRTKTGMLRWLAGGVTGYEEAEFRRLVEARENSLSGDGSEADQRTRELWPILHEDVPMTVLLPFPQITVAHRRVRGLRTPDRLFVAEAIEHLWIEDTP